MNEMFKRIVLIFGGVLVVTGMNFLHEDSFAAKPVEKSVKRAADKPKDCPEPPGNPADDQPKNDCCPPDIEDGCCPPEWLYNQMKWWCDMSKCHEINVEIGYELKVHVKTEACETTVNLRVFYSPRQLVKVAQLLRKDHPGKLKMFRVTYNHAKYERAWK